jgi:hypothetical protein
VISASASPRLTRQFPAPRWPQLVTEIARRQGTRLQESASQAEHLTGRSPRGQRRDEQREPRDLIRLLEPLTAICPAALGFAIVLTPVVHPRGAGRAGNQLVHRDAELAQFGR